MMNSKRLKLVVPSDARGVRLDHWLVEQIKTETDLSVSKSQIRQLLQAGAVYLNGKQVRIASKGLIPTARVEVFLDLLRMKTGVETVPSQATLPFTTLYRDEFIWVVNKASGLPTQPTIDPKRPNLFHQLQTEEKKMRDQTEDRGLPYVGLHHRLDRDTSGIVLFTVSELANKGIADLFKNHDFKKTYECLVQTELKEIEKNKTIESYLKPYRVSAKLKKMKSVSGGGDYAKTGFELINLIEYQQKKWAYLRATPVTGRMHQIRVHASEAGFPLLGDLTYGGVNQIEFQGAKRKINRVMLHARKLEFKHPMTGKNLIIEAPLPQDFLELKEWLKL